MIRLKWIYLLFLVQNAFAFQGTFRKAVVHIDRITQDDHYLSAGGTLTKIKNIPLPPGSVMVRFCYDKTQIKMLFLYIRGCSAQWNAAKETFAVLGAT